MTATLAAPTRTVYVVSWVYWNGDEQGGGGFDWYPARHEAAAFEAFDREKAAWDGSPARIRLLRMDVPADLDGEALTNWLDEDIDALEVTEPALRVALVGCPQPATAAR